MAIRKKQTARKGFSHPSRKQRNWEQEKAGDAIKFPERRNSRTNGDIVNAGDSILIYTCPINRRAKIIYAALSTSAGEGYIELLLQSGITFLLHTYVANNLNFAASYEDGIDLEPGNTVRITCTGPGTTIGTVQIIEEDVSPGYIISN